MACENICKLCNCPQKDWNSVETLIELGALIALSYFGYYYAQLYIYITLVKFCDPVAGLLFEEVLVLL